MATLSDVETLIESQGNATHYRAMESYFSQNNRSDVYNQIRYMLALSYNFQENSQQEGLMFVGSLGVLGNIVSVCGERTIPEFRDIHDLDLLVSKRAYASFVDTAFDEVVNVGYSHSINNKLTIEGLAIGSRGDVLLPTSVDVYVAAENCNSDSQLLGTVIDQDHWNERTIADFFGVPVYCAPPLPLLEMKLAVSCSSNGHPRGRDCEDVRNLLGVLEHKSVSPDFISRWVPAPKKEKLQKILNGECKCYEENIFLDCSESYRRVLAK